MAAQHVLDFPWIDIESAGDDHVLFSIYNPQEAIGVTNRDIAGVKPAAGEGLRGEFRPIEIPCHDQRATHANLTSLTWRYLSKFVIEQCDVDPRHVPTA